MGSYVNGLNYNLTDGFNFNYTGIGGNYGLTDSIVTGAELEGLGVLDDDANNDLENREDNLNDCPGCEPPGSDDKYCGNILLVIQLLYILSALLWIYLIYQCELYKDSNILIWILLVIPIVVFAIGYYNACQVTLEIETYMLQSNYLSFGFLITIILLNWNSPLNEPNKNKFFKLLVIAFILIMLSMIDVWVDRQHFSLMVHFKSILQTAALVILSIALYSYYRAHEKSMHMGENKSMYMGENK